MIEAQHAFVGALHCIDCDRQVIYELRAELKEAREAVKWRPISEMHEDFGPCILVHSEDPGFLQIGTNLDTDYLDVEWTHFCKVPNMSEFDLK